MTTGSAPKGRGWTGPLATTKQRGDAAEMRAMAYLHDQGLRLVCRNFHTPGRGGGEIDLIMKAPDGTIVFVEVRQRRSSTHGGAAGSVGVQKQRRIVFAARHFLMRWPELPACRFDVLTLSGDGDKAEIDWILGAFTAEA